MAKIAPMGPGGLAALRPIQTSAVSAILANYRSILDGERGSGDALDSDLLLSSVPQVLERLGRPSTTYLDSEGGWSLSYRVGQETLFVLTHSGTVIRVSVGRD